MLLIKNGHIKPMVGNDIHGGCVLIDDDGKISAVGADIPVPEGCEVIDAKGRLVTPGCVDATATSVWITRLPAGRARITTRSSIP